jgi:hypothetical protein
MEIASIGHCNYSFEHTQYVGVEPFASSFSDAFQALKIKTVVMGVRVAFNHL